MNKMKMPGEKIKDSLLNISMRLRRSLRGKRPKKLATPCTLIQARLKSSSFRLYRLSRKRLTMLLNIYMLRFKNRMHLSKVKSGSKKMCSYRRQSTKSHAYKFTKKKRSVN